MKNISKFYLKNNNTMDFAELTHKWLHNRILDVFSANDIPKDAKILDIWCGNWNFLNKLHKKWYLHLYGCDGFIENEKMLNIAQFKKQNLNEKLSYEDKYFDYVILTEVIEHLENPNDLLKEIHRVLKSGWFLLLSTPNVHTLVSRLLFLFTGKMFQFTKKDVKFTVFPGHIAPFFPYIFEEVFRHMFKIARICYSNFIMPILWREFPIRNKLFGNTVILVVKKI